MKRNRVCLFRMHIIGGIFSIFLLFASPIAFTQTLDYIAIDGAAEVNENSSANYTCTAYYDDGSSADVTELVTWSEDSIYATIDTNGFLSTSIVPTDQQCQITADYSGQTAAFDVTIKNVNTLVIDGSIEVNELTSANYTCTFFYGDGSSEDVTEVVTWSEDSIYVNIDVNGFLSADAVPSNQQCRITATYNGEIATFDVTIKNLFNLVIDGSTEVNENSSANYACTAVYEDGSPPEDVTELVTWSENSIYSSIDTNGLLSTIEVPSDQQCTITATYNGETATFDVTIKDVVALDHITIDGPTEVNENSSADYTCTAYYDDGSSADVTELVTWSEDSIYASIDTNGQLTTIFVASDQQCQIGASYEGKLAAYDITIKDVGVYLDHIAITGGPSTIIENASAYYSCTAYYDNGDSYDVTGVVNWTIVPVDIASIDSDGLFQASEVSSDQQCTLTATYTENSITKTAEFIITILNIPDSIAISGPIEVNENSSADYTCIAAYDDGTTKTVTNITTWSENSIYASINANGHLTTIMVPSEQQCRITASYAGIQTTYDITIKDTMLILDHIAISGPLEVGENTAANFTCTAYFDNNTTQDVTDSAVWSEDSTYANFLSPGNLETYEVSSDQPCQITVTYEGKTATYNINIAGIPVSIEIGGLSEINEGQSANYTCTATFDDGTTKTVTNSTTWSEDSVYATIDAGGKVTTSYVPSNQTFQITAVCRGITAQKNVTIKNTGYFLDHITIDGPTEVNENSSADYICYLYYDSGAFFEINPTWGENSIYATINATGLLTTSAVPSDQPCQITATYSGLNATYDITIKNVPAVTSLEITGDTEVKEGTSADYECIAYYDNGTNQTVTNSAAWSLYVENSNYATINSNGHLVVSSVPSDITINVIAKYAGITFYYDVKIINHTLDEVTSFKISGSPEVRESTPSQYTCTALYIDGYSEGVTAFVTWSDDSAFADFDTNAGKEGLLIAYAVTKDELCRIAATYQELTAYFDVVIKNSLGVELISSYTTPDKAYDVYVSGNLAYVAANGKGLQIIDVSNANYPWLRGYYDTPGNAWGVYVSGSLAYIADGGSGLQIINVSDPSQPTLQGKLDTPNFAFDVFVLDNKAYIADGTTGLQIIDVSDPSHPVLLGNYNTPMYAMGVYVSGNLAYVADYSSGLYIIDVSNPYSPTLKGGLDTSGYAYSVQVVGNLAYLADGGSGLEIIDVSDPTKPTIKSSIDTNNGARGVYIAGDTAYVADMNNSVYIFNISDATNPTLTCSYDAPAPAYAVWNSGNIIYVADSSSGLLLLSYTREIIIPKYEFNSTEDGWTSGGYPEYFTLPEFTYDNSSGSLIIQSKDSYTFGFWRGPLDGIPYVPNSIYKATFTVRGSAPQDEAPAFRFHLDTQSAALFGVGIVESWMGGTESPDWNARDYTVYFDPMDQSGYQNNEVTDDLFAGFDIMNFEPTDNPYGAYFIDGVTIERFYKSEIDASAVKTYDTSSDFSNWVFGGYPELFNLPSSFAGDEYVGIIANNDNINTYGYWESSRTANEVDIQPNTVYRARFTVATGSTPDTCPQLRLRVGTESNKMASAYIVNSNLDGINSPSLYGSEYDVYFCPPQSDIGGPENANGLIFAMDMLNFNPNDDANGVLVLYKLEVQAIDIDSLP